MKVLSKRAALLFCKRLWTILALNPDMTSKVAAYEKMGYKLHEIQSLCPCCDYDNSHMRDYCGDGCLLPWVAPDDRLEYDMQSHCMNENSPFHMWQNAKSMWDREQHALAIVRLCEVELAKL